MNPAPPVTSAFVKLQTYLLRGSSVINHRLPAICHQLIVPPREYIPRRTEDELDVQPGGPVVNVLQVQFDPLVELFRLPSDVPEADHTGRDAEFAPLPIFEVLPLLRANGAGADQAHVAFEDAPELGKFIQAELAQKSPHGCDTGIVFHFEGGTTPLIVLPQFLLKFVGVDDHGTEFVAGESPAILTNHLPLIKDGTWRG